MKITKYFIQFLIIIFLFFIFKLIGLKYSKTLSGKIFSLIGPLFRSNNISNSNLSKGFPDLIEAEKKKIDKENVE